MTTLEQVHVRGSHFEVGVAIGQRFGSQIHRALDGYAFLQTQVLPHVRTGEGQAAYREFLQLHRSRYPDYLAELEGLARGADRPFDELFLVNLRNEFASRLRERAKGCSDLALLTKEAALIGHNEDGAPAFRDNMYLVRVQVDDKPAFTALSYPGFLCGNAFGFNDKGVCVSVDHVQPLRTRLGLGRHFVARSMLEARSLADAVRRATVPGRATGFGYTLGSTVERRIVRVEVAPESHQVREIDGAYVCANHYRELAGIEQEISPSSRSRLARAEALLAQTPPRQAADVLSILGDRAGEQYPIYRTATPPDGSATLCTALFDLDAGRLRIYTSHPVQAPEEFVELRILSAKEGTLT